MEDGPFICSDCIGDEDLADHIEFSATAKSCSFCANESKDPIAAPLENICEIIRECVERDYTDPANELPYESREGGYQGTVYDTHEVIFEVIGLELGNDDDSLRDEIADRVDYEGQNAWCEKDYFAPDEHQYLTYSWSHFCHLITHERRFFFQNVVEDPDNFEVIPANEMLVSLRGYFEDFDLFSELRPSQTIYRARFCEEGEELISSADLGSPPDEKAIQANRMSPPGIPMFYGSTRIATALKETANGVGTFVIGSWRVLEAITVLDLTKLPTQVGFFDQHNDDVRHIVNFLNNFVEELARPIERDRSTIHVEYVPTQVLTEFVRFTKFQFNTETTSIRGILYPSAIDGNGASLVLFATQDDIVGASEFPMHSDQPWLELVGHRKIEVTKTQIESWKEENRRPTLYSL